jgi:hypothetical protein
MKRRCFVAFALAPEGLTAVSAYAQLSEFVADPSHGLPVFHDHFSRKPHGGIAVIFPRNESECARLDELGLLVDWEVSISPLAFALTPIGFAAQTSFTLDWYGHVSLEELATSEKPNPAYWWRRRKR